MDFVTQKPSVAVLPDFRIFETDEFLKRLKKLSSRDAAFLRRKLDSFVYPRIREQPFFGKHIKKLHGYSPETRRYRIGKYRLFYVIDQEEQIVYVLTIDDRKDAYK